MPSRKPFVIAYISIAVAEALQADAERLTALAERHWRTASTRDHVDGAPIGIVQSGQVAVEQIRMALAKRSFPRLPLPDEPRPLRRRWLVDPDLHKAIHARARQLGVSVSELVARILWAVPAHVASSYRFPLPKWAFEALRRERWREEAADREHRKHRQRSKTQRKPDAPKAWPWRVAGITDEEAKRAFRIWALEHHPDKGGDTAQFVRGKDDYEQLKRAA